jgi:UPF0755 protein
MPLPMSSSTPPRHRTLVLALVLLLLLATGVVGTGVWLYRMAPLPLAAPEVEVDIARGTSGMAVATTLAEQGVPVRPWLFRLALRLRGDGSRIRAGSYQVSHPITLAALLDRLTRGDVRMRDFLLVEGWNWRQVRQALAQQPDLRHEAAALTDAEILSRIGATETHPEGLFAPDTYAFVRGTSDLDILRRAYRLQRRHLDDTWARAAERGLPYRTAYELLTMASIIEKETGREEDRPKVAAVFVNRLNRGMMLQSDPTTIYGLGESFDGNLRRKDLVTDSPYNTYTRHGLTPTPIAMPGRASLEAGIAPASINALFFVARGDGSSEFSDDYAAHNRAVNRYQRKQ